MAMSKYQYTNDTDSNLVIVGIGVVKAGETLESDELIENPNLTVATTKSVNKESNDVERTK